MQERTYLLRVGQEGPQELVGLERMADGGGVQECLAPAIIPGWVAG